MLLILPLGGEGTWAVRTGSSIVMETPDFCWLMDLRVKVSPNVTEKRAQEQFSGVSLAGSQLPLSFSTQQPLSHPDVPTSKGRPVSLGWRLEHQMTQTQFQAVPGRCQAQKTFDM